MFYLLILHAIQRNGKNVLHYTTVAVSGAAIVVIIFYNPFFSSSFVILVRNQIAIKRKRGIIFSGVVEMNLDSLFFYNKP